MPWLAWIWHPAPFRPAHSCERCVRRGHDGRIYMSLPTRGGAWRWVQLDRRVSPRNARAIDEAMGGNGDVLDRGPGHNRGRNGNGRRSPGRSPAAGNDRRRSRNNNNNR